MRTILLIPGALIGIGVVAFMLLFLLLIISVMIGLVNKDFTFFKKVGRYTLFDIAFIFIAVIIWGILMLVSNNLS